MTQEIKNLLDSIFKLGDWVNTYWIFYAVFNIAMIGWITSSPIAWNWEKRLFISFGYGLVVSVNLFAQYRTTRFMGLAIKELKAMVAATENVTRTEELKNEVINFRYIDTPLIIAVHLIMDVMVIVCIWLRGKF